VKKLISLNKGVVWPLLVFPVPHNSTQLLSGNTIFIKTFTNYLLFGNKYGLCWQ